MTSEEKAIGLRARIKKLEGTEKNRKCPGVLRKLKRQLKKYEMYAELGM